MIKRDTPSLFVRFRLHSTTFPSMCGKLSVLQVQCGSGKESSCLQKDENYGDPLQGNVRKEKTYLDLTTL